MSIGAYCIPMLFIHMVPGPHLVMKLTKIDGKFRVAFYIEMSTVRDTDQKKDFFANFEYQCILAKG